jgi:pilus assembly protein CpaE
MTAVIGARGGSGASTIATSVAWLLADKERRSTSLLDLDLHFGTGALTLDLEPGRGLTDAIENPSRIDGLFIERAMVKASEKLAILSAEAPIHQPTLTDGTAYHLLQEEMKTAFECTVIDLPRNVLVQHPHLMAEVHSTVVVAELTLASARDVIRILSWLKSNAPQSQVVVALNKVVAGATPEITKKDFEASIERKIDVVIPYDLKITSQAAKLGKTVADAGKGSKIAGALMEVSAKVLATVGQMDEAAPRGAAKAAAPKPSLMAKITDLKSLLPTRAAKQADTAPAA